MAEQKQRDTQYLLHVWLSPELTEKLQRMAAATQRTQSDMIRWLIRQAQESRDVQSMPLVR